MTKLEDKCMTIENKMMGLGLKFYECTKSLLTDKLIMRFGPVEKRKIDEVFGDVKLELDGLSDTNAFIDGKNYICVMFNKEDEQDL